MKKHQSQGMALLMVMLLLALMATLAVVINQFWQQAFNRTLAVHSRLQAKWHLLGGEIYAKERLYESLKEAENVNLAQAWAQSGRTMQTEEGDIAFSFTDAQSCFNINGLNYKFSKENQSVDKKNKEEKSDEKGKPATLVTQTEPRQQEPPEASANITYQVLEALLTNLGFNEVEIEQFVKDISTRIAPDNKQSTSMGTEIDHVVEEEDEGAIEDNRNEVFSDLSELRTMQGITRERYLLLRPFLCILPGQQSQININTLQTAHLPLLRALFLNKTSIEEMQQLINARPANGWTDMKDPEMQRTLLALSLPPLAGEKLLTTQSHYFHLRLSTENQQVTYYLFSLLHYEKQRISVVSHRLGQGGEE